MQERFGRFYIQISDIAEFPKQVREMLAQTIVVRAENLYVMRSIEYYAISDLFDQTDAGVTAQEYRLVWKDGVITAEKVNPGAVVRWSSVCLPREVETTVEISPEHA